MKNKKIVSGVLLAVVLFCAAVGILIPGVGAQGTHESYVVDGVGGKAGYFATVREALLAAGKEAPRWAAGSDLTISLKVDERVDSTENDILFDVSTIFTSDGKKLPITIRSAKEDASRAALILAVEGTVTHDSNAFPMENWHCTNDYTFSGLAIRTDKAGSKTFADLVFAAGSGNVVFDSVVFGTTEGGEATLFFACDNNCGYYGNAEQKLYDSWTAENIRAEKARYETESGGLLRSSLTFRNTTYDHMPSTNWQSPSIMVRKNKGTPFNGKDGAILSPAETEARLIVEDGAKLGRLAGFYSSNSEVSIEGKIVIEMRGGTVEGISADPACYHAAKTAGKKKHAVVDVILKGGTVNPLKLAGTAFAVTGGAHSDYDETSEINLFVEEGAVIGGNLCGIGGLGSLACEEKHTLSPKGKVNIYLNGGTVNGNVYGVYGDAIAHRVGGEINIYAKGSALSGSLYGMDNKGSFSGKLLLEIGTDFSATASAINAGTLTEGARAGIQVSGGTVAGTVSAVSGTATVQKGAEAYLGLLGGTVKKHFLITVGSAFSVEEGGKASAYIHGGNLHSARVGSTSGRGTVFSSVAADRYADVEKAYTKNGVVTYPDNLKKGSLIYIELGQAESYTPDEYCGLVNGGMIGGDLTIKYLPGTKLSGSKMETLRNLYSGIVLGDYTLEINSEGKEPIDATGVAIQGEWSGKVLGNAKVVAKNLDCYNFFTVAGRNTETRLDHVRASGLIGFTRGSYNVQLDMVNGEAVGRIDTVTGYYSNCTTVDFYGMGYNTSSYKMDATIVNSFENCTVTGNFICGGYRFHTEGKTYATHLLGSLTSNFLGGNRITGRFFGGSASVGGTTCSSDVVNETGDIILNFNAPASNPDEFHTVWAGNGVIGDPLPSEKYYLDGTVRSLTVNVGEYTTFHGDVFTGSRGGAESPDTVFTVRGGDFRGRLVGSGVTLCGGTFRDAVEVDGLVLADGARITIRDRGFIHAQEVKGKITLHKADPWESFDTVYLRAPASAAGLITVTDEEDYRSPLILTEDTFEVRGWYPTLYATLVLKERLYLKLSLDSAVAENYLDLADKFSLSVTYGGDSLGLTVQDLTGEGFLLATQGAAAFDRLISYSVNGEEVLSSSVREIALNGAYHYAEEKEIANLFSAIARYGDAAAGRAFEFTVNDVLAIQRYGNDVANIDPAEFGVSRDATCGVDFTNITLLMGDTVGIRLKVSDSTKSALSGVKLYQGSVSSANLLRNDTHYLLQENSIDLFIHAEDFETVTHLIAVDAKGKVCLDLKTSVSYLMYEMVKSNLTAPKEPVNTTLVGTDLQATALFVVRTNEYLDYLAEQNSPPPAVTLPKGTSVGYARIDCTPADALSIYDATSYTAHDPLMITCTAFSDGKKAALVMSVDFKGISASVSSQAAKLLEEAYGISPDCVMFSATHTHSAPTMSGSSAAMTRWIALFYKQVVKVAGQALADLSPAEALAGKGYTDCVNFVRRYELASGAYQTNPQLNQADPPIRHESEADNEVRVIRFVREGKKDILIMNFQTHYGMYVEAYSADFIHYLRQWSEEEMDVHFAYYSGASGNLNMAAKFPNEKKYKTKTDIVKAMWQTAKKATEEAVPIALGKVSGYKSLYSAKVLKDSETRVAQAREINRETDETKKAELMKKYGFGSSRWVQGVITRASLGETQEIPFSGISFGSIAFSSSPIEQFDANAKWVRENSPFRDDPSTSGKMEGMTFTLSLTNGSYGYVPTAEAFPHGAYEVAVSRYIPGSGEEFAAEQLRLLNLCYNEQ